MIKLLASVIVIAFDRRQFILESVHSVLNQSVNRDEYEIIVIKNFKDGEIDGFLEKNRVLCINSANRSLSGKIAESLNYATGKYMCFLEDDDLWAPSKLSSFFSLLKKFGDIDFYHNGNIHFKTGEKSFLSFKNTENVDSAELVSMKEANRSFLKFNKLIRNNLSYNLSSMIIKTDLLRFHSNLLFEFGSDYVDSLLFYISIVFGNKLLIDRQKLTAVRVHNANRSGINLGKGPNGYLDVFYTFLKSTENQVIRNNIFQLLSRIELDRTVKNPKCKRSDSIRSFVVFTYHSIACRRIPDLDMLIKSFFRMFGIIALTVILGKYHS